MPLTPSRRIENLAKMTASQSLELSESEFALALDLIGADLLREMYRHGIRDEETLGYGLGQFQNEAKSARQLGQLKAVGSA